MMTKEILIKTMKSVGEIVDDNNANHITINHPFDKMADAILNLIDKDKDRERKHTQNISNLLSWFNNNSTKICNIIDIEEFGDIVTSIRDTNIGSGI